MSRPLPRPEVGTPNLRGRPVLVTGATGFLGRHLCRALDHLGAEVHALTRSAGTVRPSLPVTWHGGDLGDLGRTRALLGMIRPAAVFHLASRVQGHRDVELVLPMLEANTRAAIHLMTAAHEHPGCRVVLAGSIEEPRGDDPPVSPYAAAKAAGTGYARLFGSQWDLAVTVLRVAMVYGPDQPDVRKLVPYVCTSLLAGTAPSLGSGSRPVDWVYVEDVCAAFVRAAVSPPAPGLVVDIGSGRTATVADVVTELAGLAGHDGPLGFGARDDRRHEHAHVADTAPAALELGWRATTPLREGLARTLEWYRETSGT